MNSVYTYDEQDRLISITDEDGFTLSIQYVQSKEKLYVIKRYSDGKLYVRNTHVSRLPNFMIKLR